MEARARKFYIATLLTLIMATGCIPATATPAVEAPPAPSSTSTALPAEEPTRTPDPDFATAVAADVYCGTIPEEGSVIGTLAQALLSGGSPETTDSIREKGWFVSLDTDPTQRGKDTGVQHVFTVDAQSALLGGSFVFNNVKGGMTTCTSPSSLRASFGR